MKFQFKNWKAFRDQLKSQDIKIATFDFVYENVSLKSYTLWSKMLFILPNEVYTDSFCFIFAIGLKLHRESIRRHTIN